MNVLTIDAHGIIHVMPYPSGIGAVCGARAWPVDQPRVVTCLWCAASSRRRAWRGGFL